MTLPPVTLTGLGASGHRAVRDAEPAAVAGAADRAVGDLGDQAALPGRAAWGRPGPGGAQKVSPVVVKNQSDEVSHSPVSAVNTSPPRTGSAQRGPPDRLSSDIFATNAP